jgi:hypothetical protein
VEGSLVLDAKYMSVGTAAQGRPPHRDETGRIHLREYEAFDPFSEEIQEEEEGALRQVKNSHLYQVLAYATHRDIQADRAALVYPVVEGEEEAGDMPGYHGLGHRSTHDLGDLPIHMCTVRIDRAGIGREVEGKGLLRKLSERLL